MSRTSELTEYRKTKHWKEVKKFYANEPCELCRAKRKKGRVFIVHHKHYNSLGYEKREDVQILCRRCHSMCHDIMRMKVETDFVKELKEYIGRNFIYENNKVISEEVPK